MTRGRKPRALEVQQASGAFEKNPSRKPAVAVRGADGDPVPPDFIVSDKTALKVWDEVVEVLRAANILTRTDTHLLATYCSTYSQWSRLHTHLSNKGHADENGKTSPESVAYFKLSAQHLKLVSELGLSPSSRARLSVAKSDAQEEEATSLASIIAKIKG
jgi:P27 family predicted phage terminase small subunit